MPDLASHPANPPRTRLLATAIVVLAFAIPAAALIAAGVNRGARLDDQRVYHVPTVWQIAGQWPHLEVNSYPAAMTPGYHLLMAAVARAGGGIAAMQGLTALLTCGLLATLAWAASRRLAALDAVLLCLPAAWSPYLFTAGIYVVPHNLAWWGVLGVMLLALRREHGPMAIAIFALLFAAIIGVYQLEAWVLAPMLVSVWIGDTAPGRDLQIASSPRRVRHAVGVLLAAIPGFLLLAWFVKQWGGLAPHTQGWVRPVTGVNFAAIVMILATCGALGLGYAGWFWRSPVRRWAIVGATIALAIALVPPTTYDKDAGRWSGLWNVAGALPLIRDRSPVIILLAAIGGFVLGVMLGVLPRRERWIFAAALAGFVAAHSAINQAWQRYYEPMILMTFALAASDLPDRIKPSQVTIARIALAGLAVVQAGLTMLSLR
jgi:hypothetical protein